MKKILAVLSITMLLSLAIFSQRAEIIAQVMEIGLERRMGANTIAELQDGLHLTLCGAGGPMPAPKASGPCVAVIAGKQLFIVDAGTDGVRNLTRMGYSAGDINAVLLTHFHSDHIDGLGELATLRWVSAAKTTPLPVYGPTGVEQVVSGFNTSYAADMNYRHAHHGDTVAPVSGAGMQAMPFTPPPLGRLTTVIAVGDLTIEALTVDHFPVVPAVGYRFIYKDRSLLITGDTVKLPNIQMFARDVDLLVHEALAPNLLNMMHETAENIGDSVMAKITHDVLDYHASPVEAAETARDAGVGHLLYYHIVPPLVLPGQKALYLDGAEKIFANYTIGEDGTSFSLPAGSEEILMTRKGL